MNQQPYQISLEQIRQFTEQVNHATIPQLTCVIEFHNQVLLSLLPEKRVKGYYYSESLSQLLVVLMGRVKAEPNILQIYPEIARVMQTLCDIIHNKHYLQIRRKLQHNQGTVKHQQQLVFRKYIQSQKLGPIHRKNWLHTDQKTKKLVNASQMVNEALGPQWANIIDHFQFRSDDSKQKDSRQKGSRQKDSRQKGSRQKDSRQKGSKQKGSRQKGSRQKGSKQKGSKQKRRQKRQKDIMYTLNRQSRTLDCLGCAEYFEQSQMLKFQKDQQNDFIVFPSAKAIRTFQLQLKQSICALINSYGGYILFACTQEKLKLFAQGETLNEVNKQSIFQQLNQFFQAFIPKLTFASNAHLSFVPVTRSPNKTQNEGKMQKEPNFKSAELQFFEGKFVTRLKIWSHKKQRLFWYQQLGQVNLLRRPEGVKSMKVQVQKLSQRQVLRQLKKRFKGYYSKDAEQLEQVLIQTYKGVNEHKCKQPFVGKKSTLALREMPMPTSGLFELQNNYKYTSMLILKNLALSKIKSYFISQNITGFQFMPEGTQIAKDAKLLFHETSPHKLQQIVAKYSQGSKNVIFLIIDNAIKLKSALKQWQFSQLRDYLKAKRLQSQLSYYRHHDGKETSWFLNCASRVDIFFIFNKLRIMSINGARLVRIDTTNKIFEPIYSS